jgi:transposase-like protein
MSSGRPRDLKRERTWRRHFERQEASGLSVRDYCCRHDLTESAFYVWRRVIRERDQDSARPAPVFVPVTVVDRPTRSTGSAINIILADGRRVRVCPGCDRELLATVLAVVEGRPC